MFRTSKERLEHLKNTVRCKTSNIFTICGLGLSVGLTPASSAGKQRLIPRQRNLPPVLLYRFMNYHLISVTVDNWKKSSGFRDGISSVI